MLSRISYPKFLEWMVFWELEPFGEERDDHRTAQIVEAVINMQRDTKAHPSWIPRERFLLGWGDYLEDFKPKKQDVQYMQRVLDAWIFTSNAALSQKKES
jgi:hypothetical protein